MSFYHASHLQPERLGAVTSDPVVRHAHDLRTAVSVLAARVAHREGAANLQQVQTGWRCAKLERNDHATLRDRLRGGGICSGVLSQEYADERLQRNKRAFSALPAPAPSLLWPPGRAEEVLLAEVCDEVCAAVRNLPRPFCVVNATCEEQRVTKREMDTAHVERHTPNYTF